MKKRTILICGLLALTLASCDTNPYDDPIGGGGNNGSITDPWWTTEGELTFDGDGNVVLDEVDIHITTVVNGDDYAKFQDIVSDFNREYRGQINVTTDTVNQVGFEQAVANRINQNSNAPDLIMSHQKGHKSFANSKLIQPFNEIFDELNIDFSYDNFASNISSYANLDYEDYYFDVPIDAQSMVIYYNKDILKKYSEDGNLPTNREEFFALCREAQEGERKTNKDVDVFVRHLPSTLKKYGRKSLICKAKNSKAIFDVLNVSNSLRIASFSSSNEKNFRFLSFPTTAIVQSPTAPSTAALSFGLRTLVGSIVVS